MVQCRITLKFGIGSTLFNLFILIILCSIATLSQDLLLAFFRLASLLLFNCSYDRRKVCLPLLPIPVNYFRHVFWLFIRILKEKISRFFGALPWVPVRRNSPLLTAWFKIRQRNDLDRKVAVVASSCFKHGIVLHIHFNEVLNLEYLSDPGGAEVYELFFFV